jgi:hypothetical protein
MSTVNAYSAWLNGKGSVSVLCGTESDSLATFSLGLSAKLTRTTIHVFAPAVFETSFGIAIDKIQGSDSKNPFRFMDNGIKPINLESVFGRAVRIQIVETSDFNEAVGYKIINEKDANGAYIIRESAYKLDRETKSRVTDSNGNFVYRKCFLRPDIAKYDDVTTQVAQSNTVDINSLTENVPVEEDANVDNVPF